MKTALLSVILVLAFTGSHAQNEDPYAIFGHKSAVNYESNIHDFLYIKNTDTCSEFKAIALDARSGKIFLLGTDNCVIQSFDIEPTEILTWVSVDPKADKYPSLSPYNYVANNPLNAIDPNGKDVVFLIDKNGAGGKGHMGMLFQDKGGAWFYFSQGAAEQGSFCGFASGSNYAGGVGIIPLQSISPAGGTTNMTKDQALEYVTSGNADGTQYSSYITLKTTKTQDGNIFNNAYSAKSDFESGKQKYNAHSNNCAGAVIDVVSGTNGTKNGINLPTLTDPRPNSYFKKLESSIPCMNGDVKLLTVPSTLDNIPPKQIVVPYLQ